MQSIRFPNRSRLTQVFLSATPWLIILGLLWAGLFIKPQPVGFTVQPPPIERSDAFYGIAVPLLKSPAKTLWMVGNNGKVVRSEDEGAHWIVQQSPTKSHLQDIATWDAEHAIAVGNNGTVIVTSDAGKTWKEVSAPLSKISNKLLKVKTLQGGRAWAVGEMSAVLESNDYGLTWQRRRDEQDVAWNDIAFMDASNGWIVGETGRMLHTKNGGESWELIQSPVKSSLMSVAFRDAENGVVVGLEGVILVTRDGGKTWLHQPRAKRLIEDVAGAGKTGAEKNSSSEGDVPTRARTVEEAGEHLLDVIWDEVRGVWVAVGNQGVWVRSDKDAEQWMAGSIDPRDLAWHTRIVAANGRYYLAGARSGIWGETWQAFANK